MADDEENGPLSKVSAENLWEKVLAGASAAGAGGFVAFVENPGRWIREELVGVFLSMVASVLNYLGFVGAQMARELYLGLWVPLAGVGNDIVGLILLPYDVLEEAGLNMIATLGIAAPFAVLIVQMVSVLITVLLLVALWELAKTYLPLESVEDSVLTTLSVAREQLGALVPESGEGGGDE